MVTIQYRPRLKTRAVILHDSHTGPEVTNTLEHLRVQGRQKGLLDVGYHVVIERSGIQHMTRPLNVMGSHLPGNNFDTIGVCLAGNEEAGVTEEQIASLFCLMVGHEETAGLPLLGHYEIPRSGTRRSGCKCPCLDMNKLRYKLFGRETPQP